MARALNLGLDLADKIALAANEAASEHKFSPQPLVFIVKNGEVTGNFKLSKNVAQANADIKFALNLLSKISASFSVAWEIFAGEKIGEIVGGKLDESVTQMLVDFKNLSANHALKAAREKWLPADKGKKPRGDASRKAKFKAAWNKQREDELLSRLKRGEVATGELGGVELAHGGNFKFHFANAQLAYSNLVGKMGFERSNLDFSELNLDALNLSECRLQGAKAQIRLHMALPSELKFSRSDFSYAQISLFQDSFDAGKAVTECKFDYAKFKDIVKIYFKNCSFKNANFNGAQIERAVFEDCDFTGASFDSTHFIKAKFIRPKGANRQKMIEYTLVIYGEKISNLDDIAFKEKE